jgi:hypothetical protein
MFFSTISTLDQFRQGLSEIDDDIELSRIRNVVRKYRGDHPLRDPHYGFARVYTALKNRADQLGFFTYSFGFRKPLEPRS